VDQPFINSEMKDGPARVLTGAGSTRQNNLFFFFFPPARQYDL